MTPGCLRESWVFRRQQRLVAEIRRKIWAERWQPGLPPSLYNSWFQGRERCPSPFTTHPHEALLYSAFTLLFCRCLPQAQRAAVGGTQVSIYKSRKDSLLEFSSSLVQRKSILRVRADWWLIIIGAVIRSLPKKTPIHRHIINENVIFCMFKFQFINISNGFLKKQFGDHLYILFELLCINIHS